MPLFGGMFLNKKPSFTNSFSSEKSNSNISHNFKSQSITSLNFKPNKILNSPKKSQSKRKRLYIR
jgi:hypothetical protein